ncbi:MAG TPA: GNAT family N-acetyltransferase [Candidatus Baltobacteraceae bacterium]|jgi:ribosomal-protein-alanine N-acetyltransferase
MRTIRTERLRLTPVTAQNAAALWHVLQQPDLRMYQDLPNVSATTFAQMVARRPRRLLPGESGRYEWLVYMHRVRKALGWVSLRVPERERSSGEIGYSIVHDFRGRGIASEAVGALVGEAFESGALDRVRAYCVPENTASRRVLERNGFISDGVLAHGASVNGRVVDVLAHVLDRERWSQSGNSMEISASA